MRLLCFTKSDGNAPSTRLRVVGLLDVASRQGWLTQMVTVRALPWWKLLPVGFFEFFHFWSVLRTVDSSTVVVLQRTLRRPEFLWLLSRFRSRIPYIISDVDDAVWVHSPRGVETILRLSDEVWCGSDVALRYCSLKHPRTRFVPTTIDMSRFSLPQEPEKVPVVGWVGDAYAHIDNLRFFSRILKAIYKDLPPFRLRFVGVTAFEDELRSLFSFLGNNFDLIGFVSPSDIPAMISHFSIGIMPLEDTEFNRGKSALKLVEYLGAGVPVIASDIGENARVVRAPECGMLATTPREWQEALTALLSDRASRRTKGEAGQNFIRMHYDRTHVYGVLLDELRDRLFASSTGGLYRS